MQRVTCAHLDLKALQHEYRLHPPLQKECANI